VAGRGSVQRQAAAALARLGLHTSTGSVRDATHAPSASSASATWLPETPLGAVLARAAHRDHAASIDGLATVSADNHRLLVGYELATCRGTLGRCTLLHPDPAAKQPDVVQALSPALLRSSLFHLPPSLSLPAPSLCSSRLRCAAVLAIRGIPQPDDAAAEAARRAAADPSALLSALGGVDDVVPLAGEGGDVAKPVFGAVGDDKLSEQDKRLLQQELHEKQYAGKLWSLDMSQLGSCKVGEAMRIPLKEDAAPVFERPRRLSPADDEAAIKELTQMLEFGVVQRSVSAWCANLIMVAKPDGSKRLVVDLRPLHRESLPWRCQSSTRWSAQGLKSSQTETSARASSGWIFIQMTDRQPLLLLSDSSSSARSHGPEERAC